MKNNTTLTSENINTTRISFGQRLKTDIDLEQLQPITTRAALKNSKSQTTFTKRPLIHQDCLVWENIYKILFQKKLLQSKQEKKQHESVVKDQLVRETGFPTINRFTNTQTQKHFQMFLNGQIDPIQMVNQVNKQDFKEVYASLRGKRLQVNKRKNQRQRVVIFPQDDGHMKQFNEIKEFTNRVRSQYNIQKIRDVIVSRMQQKFLNSERSQSLSILGIFRSFYDASEDWINKIEQRKTSNIPHKSNEKQWKTLKIVMQKSNQTENKEKQPKNITIDAKITQGARKKLMDENIEKFLEIEKAQINQQDEEIKKEIYLKNRFKKGLRINQELTDQEKDIRLQKFLYGHLSTKKRQKYYIGHQVTYTELDRDDEAKTFNISIKKKNKDNLKRGCPSNIHSVDSGNSSLQSAHEINLDELYDESHNLQARLTQRRFKDGFGRTIKTVQRLQELQKEISHKTKNRLAGIKTRNVQNVSNL